MNYVIGKVIRGDGYGKKLGFPTANLETKEGEAQNLPPEGVYAGVAALDGKEYRAGIVVGPDNKLEAHLVGFDGDIYGQTVTLKIEKFLRKFKKFDTEEELIAQIKKDLLACSRA